MGFIAGRGVTMNDQGAVAALLQECQQALDQLSLQTPDPEGRADACCAGEGRDPGGAAQVRGGDPGGAAHPPPTARAARLGSALFRCSRLMTTKGPAGFWGRQGFRPVAVNRCQF